MKRKQGDSKLFGVKSQFAYLLARSKYGWSVEN